MIKPDDVTLELISTWLDDAVIDHVRDPENDIYVTGLPFNFWIRHDPLRPFVNFITHWDFVDDVSDSEKLRCVNSLNYDLTMVQFFIGSNSDRLSGHYALPIHEGLDRRQVLRTVRLFSSIFQTAVQSPEHRLLLVCWPQLQEDEAPQISQLH